MIAANAIAEVAPASAAKPAPTAGPGTPAFDAILMLQNLAATAECLDAANFDASETTEVVSGEDSGDDEDSGDELEASLAFLSDLLTVSAPRSSMQDMASQSQGGSSEDLPEAPPAKTPGVELLTAVAEQPAAEKESDALLTLTRPEPEPRAVSDASQNLMRAGEMLAQAQRGLQAAAIDRPAIATPVRDPRWAEELGARISMMVRAGESTASLQLTPVDLGPVEVNVTVREGQTAIHFGASQAETRALLEASLPRLREMLAAQGFNLTDASVSSGFSRSQQQPQTRSAAAAGEAETSTTEARPLRSLSLLDLYA